MIEMIPVVQEDTLKKKKKKLQIILLIDYIKKE